jgi:hypothetical protein
MRPLLILFACAGACACARPRSPRQDPEPAPAPAQEQAQTAVDLPDAIAGFAAGPLEHAPTHLRRTYVRGAARIDVTLARYPMDAEAYQSWVKMSAEGFPQAALGLPDGDGNGFYQCSAGPPERCDLLIQLRAGVHIEIRGGGTATRADLDTIRQGLPLRRARAPATTVQRFEGSRSD